MLILALFERPKKEKPNSILDYEKIIHEHQEEEAELLIKIAVLYYEEDNVKKSLESLKKAIKLFDDLGLDEKKADVLFIIGDIYLATDKKRAALKYYHQCMNLYSGTSSPYKGEVYDKVKELENELSVSKDILKEGGVTETPTEPVKTTNVEGIENIFTKINEIIGLLDESRVYRSYLQNEVNLENINEAYNLASDLGDEKTQGVLLLIMGDKNLYQKKTKESQDIFNKALNIFRKNNYTKGQAVSHLLIGVVAYLLDDEDNIKVNFKKAVELFRKIKDQYAESVAIELINNVSEL